LDTWCNAELILSRNVDAVIGPGSSVM